MKKSLIYLTLATSCFMNMQADKEELYDAISNINLKQVESGIEDLAITKQEKERLLEAADASIDLCKDSAKSIFRSGKDMLRIFFGFVGLDIGAATAFWSLMLGAAASGSRYNQDSTPLVIGLGGAAIGGTISILGLSSIVKGFSLKSAKAKLKTAMQIKRLIQDVKVV